MDELNAALEELGFEGLGGGFGTNLRALIMQARKTWGTADLHNQNLLKKLSMVSMLRTYEDAFSATVPGLSAAGRKRVLLGMILSNRR